MKEALIELARQVRGGTLDLLEATPSGWLTWAPPGTSNHILWHAGHAVWLQDALCVQPLTGRSELPEGWPITSGIIHGWHDEARHQGEMYLLLKLRRVAGG